MSQTLKGLRQEVLFFPFEINVELRVCMLILSGILRYVFVSSFTLRISFFLFCLQAILARCPSCGPDLASPQFGSSAGACLHPSAPAARPPSAHLRAQPPGQLVSVRSLPSHFGLVAIDAVCLLVMQSSRVLFLLTLGFWCDHSCVTEGQTLKCS